ncbi:MAG: HAD-IIIA family hydrolase [Campylobacterota bacterium]|nr:HAD-IIIA family hydrolase [Campylobacterota bacterium]
MIQLLVLDVDGCLTDGGITYSATGDEIKIFNVKDGLAIASWIKMGHDVAIITGRKSTIVKRRADELGIQHLFQGVHNKDEVLRLLLKDLSISLENVAAIGDDLNDANMLQLVGHSYTPQDGSRYIKKIVNTVLKNSGGKGAVREMIEEIVIQNDEEGAFLALWQ